MPSIYFAHADGRIKIGFTEKPVKGRLVQISASLPNCLELIAAIPGDRRMEGRIHAHLAAFRLKGEWFRDCEAIRELIGDLVAVSRAAILAPPAPEHSKAHRSPIFGNVCKAIWKHKTAEELAARVGCSVRAAAYELSGEREPSARSIAAVIVEITNFHGAGNGNTGARGPG